VIGVSLGILAFLPEGAVLRDRRFLEHGDFAGDDSFAFFLHQMNFGNEVSQDLVIGVSLGILAFLPEGAVLRDRRFLEDGDFAGDDSFAFFLHQMNFGNEVSQDLVS